VPGFDLILRSYCQTRLPARVDADENIPFVLSSPALPLHYLDVFEAAIFGLQIKRQPRFRQWAYFIEFQRGSVVSTNAELLLTLLCFVQIFDVLANCFQQVSKCRKRNSLKLLFVFLFGLPFSLLPLLIFFVCFFVELRSVP
jgi:RsiW-degrading membrane proteinase PrsW (M82 family)